MYSVVYLFSEKQKKKFIILRAVQGYLNVNGNAESLVFETTMKDHFLKVGLGRDLLFWKNRPLAPRTLLRY